MSKTIFNQENSLFSLWVHSNFATKEIYPKLFPGCKIKSITHQDGNSLDLKEKVDVVVEVDKDGLRQPRLFTIQERWRRIEFESYQDLTVTEWNNASGKPSEFYDGKFDFFLYGYFDEEKHRFGGVVFVDFSAMILSYLKGELKDKSEVNKKAQDFKCFSFSGLQEIGAIHWTNINDLPNKFVSKMPMEIEYWKQLCDEYRIPYLKHKGHL